MGPPATCRWLADGVAISHIFLETLQVWPAHRTSYRASLSFLSIVTTSHIPIDPADD